MALNENRRLPRQIILANRAAVVSIQSLTDFAPVNRLHNASVLLELSRAMEQAQADEILAQNTAAAARAAAVSAEWALHNTLLGAKSQVSAQYGASSDAVKAVGLKKKSDRKRPTRQK